MYTAKVDSKKRIVLPNGQPGEVYDVQRQADGRYVLVRLERPHPAPRLNRAECIKAMDAAPLSPTLSWDELRQQTREP